MTTLTVKTYIDGANDFGKAGQAFYNDAKLSIEKDDKVGFDMDGIESVPQYSLMPVSDF